MNLFFTFLIDLLFYSFIEGIIYYFVYLTYFNSKTPDIKKIISVSMIFSLIICSFVYTFGRSVFVILFCLLFVSVFFKFFFSKRFFDTLFISVIFFCIVYAFENGLNIIFIKFGNDFMSVSLDNFYRITLYLICKFVEFYFIFIWRKIKLKLGFGTVTRR